MTHYVVVSKLHASHWPDARNVFGDGRLLEPKFLEDSVAFVYGLLGIKSIIDID